MKNKMQARLAAILALAALTLTSARAQSNIDGVIDSVEGYVTAGIAVGITVLLFVLGRAVVRKLAK